jgi:hypothetical protein
MLNTVTQQIHIQVSRHAKSGLLMATSEDLPRLMVAASDDDELRECGSLRGGWAPGDFGGGITRR